MSDKEIVTKYDTFTIDTNVVNRNNIKLFNGLLNKFDQYKDGPAKFILSEVVYREIEEKIFGMQNANKSKFKSVIGNFEGARTLSVDEITLLKEVYEKLKSPSESTKKSLNDFIEFSGAEIISANNLDVQKILDLYFENQPPFGQDNKKNEFPDAIALISLEKWAEKNNKKIVAVTNDKDWQKFAKGSEYIDACENLGIVMAMLVNAKDILPEAQKVFDEVINMDSGVYFEVQEELLSAVSCLEPDFEFDGNVHYEEQGSELESVNNEILVTGDKLLEENIVSITPQEFAFEVPVTLKVNVAVFLKATVTDSIDKDSVELGNIVVEREEEIDAQILFTCAEGEISDEDENSNSEYFVDKIELLHTPMTIDLGYIEFEFPDIDYEFEQKTGR